MSCLVSLHPHLEAVLVWFPWLCALLDANQRKYWSYSTPRTTRGYALRELTLSRADCDLINLWSVFSAESYQQEQPLSYLFMEGLSDDEPTYYTFKTNDTIRFIVSHCQEFSDFTLLPFLLSFFFSGLC